MKPIEVPLNATWIKQIMELIIDNLEIDMPLGEDEREAMQNIIMNAIALYQIKITEHLVSKTDTLN